MSSEQNSQAELPAKEANPGPAKKGFRQVKKGTKKQMQQENNALKGALQNMQQSQQFLGQQVFQLMQGLRQIQDQSQAMANLLRYKQVDGPVQDGDSVMIDFSGVLTETEEIFDGGHMLGSVLVLGEKKFLQDFEDQVKGMKVGETKVVKVKFPEDYIENLKGKEAEFTVKVINAFRPSDGDTEIQELHQERVKAKQEAEKAKAEAANQEGADAQEENNQEPKSDEQSS